MGSALARYENRPESFGAEDPNYDAFGRNRGTFYENFPESFARVRSDSELEWVRSRIDKQIKDRQLLE